MYYFREKRYGFVYFVEIDGVVTSKSLLETVDRLTIQTLVQFQDPNGNAIETTQDTTNAFRYRHFFQVPLSVPMKYVDIPGFITAVKDIWTSGKYTTPFLSYTVI